jgi:E3 ubiquitin-protein ligase HECTD1
VFVLYLSLYFPTFDRVYNHIRILFNSSSGSMVATTNSVNNSRNQAASTAGSVVSSFLGGNNQAHSQVVGGNNTVNSSSATKSVSSLVRLALSSNFPSSFLDATQSYPTLSSTTSNNGKQTQQPNVSLS